MKFIKIYFTFIILCNQSLIAQTPSFNYQKLGNEQGLYSSTIFNIEQHQNGLMYFTTSNGIYYYDGYNFNKQEIDSLKNRTLLNISFKSKDELYLSIRENGLAKYNLKNKEFQFEKNLKFNNNSDNFIITKNFAYFLTSEIKLITIDLKSGKIIEDEWKLKNRMNLTNCIFKTSDNKILVGRSDGLYDATEGKQIKIKSLKNTSINSISQTKDGLILLGALNKIIILKGTLIQKEINLDFKNENTLFQAEGIHKIISDDFGRLWFTKSPDANLYLYQNNTVYDVFKILDVPSTLINCIFKDNQQNIWIGTYNDGLYFIQNSFFNSINFSYDEKNLNINKVYLKNNFLFAATNNGLFGLNFKTNKSKVISTPDDLFGEQIYDINEVGESIFYAKRSELNFTSSQYKDSLMTYKFSPILAKIFYSIDKRQSILVDWESNVLLANANGTVIIDTLISFSDYKISINSVLKYKNYLYVGTNTGLFSYDFNTKKQTQIKRNELNFIINDIALLNNKIYIAHESGITDLFNYKLIQQLGPVKLATVKKIKKFNNQIYLATLDGVFICDDNLNLLKILNKTSGMLSNSINDIAFSNEIMTIATTKGLSNTNISNVSNYSAKLNPITVEFIKSNGEDVKFENKKYNLNSNQDNISIYFFSPFFNKPNKQFFKYRLDNTEWKYFDNLVLSISLNGGKHNIEISASSDNIIWSDASNLEIFKNEKISEKKYIFWLISFGIFLFLSFVSFIAIRKVKIKAINHLQEEKKMNFLKHQALNSLLSPHFIFNSLTSIQNYINTNNSLKASEYLAKFSRLIRMIIEKASQSDITLNDEIVRLTYYLELEKERFKNKFDYVINLDPLINTNLIRIPNMIIQPYIENSIIHGILPKNNHGNLIISFKLVDKYNLLITIEDDGVGLIKAKENIRVGHKSIGTNTIENILDVNSKISGKKQKLTMIDKSTLNINSQGTIITIELEQ